MNKYLTILTLLVCVQAISSFRFVIPEEAQNQAGVKIHRKDMENSKVSLF